MIFVDKLSLKSCLHVRRIFLDWDKPQQEKSIDVLDAIPKNIKTMLLIKGLWLCGIKVHEAEFYAGHLRTRDGNNVWTAAQTELNDISFKAAKRCLLESKVIDTLNRDWRRNTVLLFLAKYFFNVAGYGGHHTIFKIMIAEALSRDRVNKAHHMILGLPVGFKPQMFEKIKGSLHLHTYLLRNKWSIRNNRLSVLLLITYVWLNRLMKTISSILQLKPEFGNISDPALLLLQEGDISMDRSYRSQPHWLFENDPSPNFRTLVLESKNKFYKQYNSKTLKNKKIFGVSKKCLYSYSYKHSIHKNINSTILLLLYQSVFGSLLTKEITIQLSLMFMKASLLASFCIDQKVKAFMTCENYYLDVDGMNLIAPIMGIRSLSYQYSNMSEIGLQMMTTANIIYTFSSMFHDRWSRLRFNPQELNNIGYPFDSSFKLVLGRSKILREELTKIGASFIICFLDESVQDNKDKYGLISFDDHLREIITLSELVLHDPSIAVIIKSQFMKNSPNILYKGNETIERAKETRRFVELSTGLHRNIIFPAEAALSSDLVIGHVVGATAGLESALVDRRCILLNPYNMQDSNIEVYKRADILYDDIRSAIEAVSGLRRGCTEFKDLGLWDSIIDQFDPYRDGQSAARLHKCLDEILLES
jgi:hypothetical protein